eukprot:6754705-Alexandrium_andersonii.AAC.1
MDGLFSLDAPAAKLMPVHLPQDASLPRGGAAPPEWLEVDRHGVAGRFNAGVCLLEPSLRLLTYNVEQ